MDKIFGIIVCVLILLWFINLIFDIRKLILKSIFENQDTLCKLNIHNWQQKTNKNGVYLFHYRDECTNCGKIIEISYYADAIDEREPRTIKKGKFQRKSTKNKIFKK